jgi:anthranilate phosphoribosyltransferase
MIQFEQTIVALENGQMIAPSMMEDAFVQMMHGAIADEKIARFLTLLKDRGETADDITAGAKILRRMASTITAPDDCVDCCGTGGDGMHSFNISTATAFVCAGVGLPMAKHGNRAASSKSGAADVLEHLGVPLTLPKETLEKSLTDIGFCFLMAPSHHAAMRHVADVRKSLGFRTIFNLLGPLANPAGTRRQLIGVYDRKWLHPMAQALQNLGTDTAWVVHGDDGLDEITLTGQTDIVQLKKNTISEFTLTSSDFGFSAVDPVSLKGGDAATNAAALLSVLKGEDSAYAQTVLANAAGVLMMAGRVPSLKDGVVMARHSIKTGAALNVLNAYRALGKAA